jgi:predicted nucleic acid-binding Zn ribbon protein
MRKLGHVLPQALSGHEALIAARAQAVLRRWPEVVGDYLAERSRPDRFHKGTVWVAVRDNVWAQELRFRREEILQRLNELSVDGHIFTSVRFGVRQLPAEEEPVVEAPKETFDTRGLSIREIAERRLANWPKDED